MRAALAVSASRPDRTLGPRCTLRADLALDSLRPGISCIAFGSLRAGGTSVALVAFGALGDVGRGGAVLVCDGDRRALGGLRDGHGRAEPVLTVSTVGPVEVAVLSCRPQVAHGLVGAVRSRVRSRGVIGGDLGRVLVRLDGRDEQRESVFVFLAADQHRLHADDERPSGNALAVVANHALSFHGTFCLLHGGRVVD